MNVTRRFSTITNNWLCNLYEKSLRNNLLILKIELTCNLKNKFNTNSITRPIFRYLSRVKTLYVGLMIFIDWLTCKFLSEFEMCMSKFRINCIWGLKLFQKKKWLWDLKPLIFGNAVPDLKFNMQQEVEKYFL